MDIIKELIKYSLENVREEALFTHIVFEMLLFEYRLVLSPASELQETATKKQKIKKKNKVKENCLAFAKIA